jgi:L-alanine-DL-glutamate epimerase-like enolase superfamily enzyme
MSGAVATREVTVQAIDVSAYTIPTDEPESDGTLQWDATTIIVVEIHAGSQTGIGYTYGDVSIGTFIDSQLRHVLLGHDAMATGGAYAAMRRAVRNAGRQGVGAMAISAVDCALWDLKARLLGVSVAALLGTVRDAVPIYGSGGFTSYSLGRLGEQLGGWAQQGIPRVKMKVGRDAAADPERLRTARAAIGDDVELMVDANGAYDPKQALHWTAHFAGAYGVTYFEEPVSSDDLDGLRLVRERAPSGMAIAAGEYNWEPLDARRMLEAAAVDILQADVTRCGGITALQDVGALCSAHGRPFSAHCAPALSTHVCAAIKPLVHLEYFHDHARVESLLFDGTASPDGGALMPDLSRPGLGIELRRNDAEPFRTA